MKEENSNKKSKISINLDKAICKKMHGIVVDSIKRVQEEIFPELLSELQDRYKSLTEAEAAWLSNVSLYEFQEEILGTFVSNLRKVSGISTNEDYGPPDGEILH